MKEPRWMQFAWVTAIHADQIKQHGGSPGIRDKGLIQSALMRPKQLWSYQEETVDLCALAASYGYGIAKNHGFIDGNKRVSFQIMYVFLGLNGFRIIAEEVEVVKIIMELAAGELNEQELADWLRLHIQPR